MNHFLIYEIIFWLKRNGMPQDQKRFIIFMDFAKIKNTAVFEKISDKYIQKHSLRGVLLSISSEIFGQNLFTF